MGIGVPAPLEFLLRLGGGTQKRENRGFFDELHSLVLFFTRPNYIEGLFCNLGSVGTILGHNAGFLRARVCVLVNQKIDSLSLFS